MSVPENEPSQNSEVPEKDSAKEDSSVKEGKETKDSSCSSGTTNEEAKDDTPENNADETPVEDDERISKRKRDDSEVDQDTTKHQKFTPTEDVTKKEEKHVENSILGLYSGSKEFTCPIAKLAQMNPGDGFFKPSKTFGTASLNTSLFTVNPEDTSSSTDTAEDDEKTALTLESSISENEKLLYESKEGVKLSVFKDNEWTMATPVMIQLISDKESEKKRIVCLQCGTGRLLLNTILLPTMSVNKLREKAIIFNGQSISDNTKLLPHRIVFSDGNNRDRFLDIYSR